MNNNYAPTFQSGSRQQSSSGYTIKKLADMSGVSVRTLHYYDEIGLLNPKKDKETGYREYTAKDALRLQQILFFRELDMPLDEIARTIDRPGFDAVKALRHHHEAIKHKIERLIMLEQTISKTINKINGKAKMSDNDLYKGFAPDKQAEYEQEIVEKYGTEKLNESKNRMKNWSKDDFQKIQDELESIHAEIAKNIAKGPESAEVQEQIARHRKWLNNFYSCGSEMHLGLGEMYRSHPDFIENYKKFLGHENGAEFMYQAIKCYCENEKKEA